MIIEYADEECYEFLNEHDNHISCKMLYRKIKDKEIIIVKENKRIIGWLRFSYFWDSIPFMNLLVIDTSYRNQGVGSSLVQYWENEMKTNGNKFVLTSTLSNETAQHFYRKLGYKDMGGFVLEVDGLEIIFKKDL